MIEGIERIVIVAGCQRSGTTLTGQMIGAHPNAHLIDEPDGLYDWFDAYFEGRLRSIGLFHRMLAVSRRKYRSEEGKLVLNEDSRYELAPHVSHLVLKAPNLTYRYTDLASLGRPVSIVYPVRDARAVVASMDKVRHQPMVQRQLAFLELYPHVCADYTDEIAILKDDTQPDHIKRALVWRIKTLMYEKFAEANLPTFMFRYEDLVADPNALLRQIADSIALPFDEAMLHHGAAYKGQGPGLTERARPVDGASLDTWTHRLTPAQAADVMAIAAGAMAKLGYQAEAKHPPAATRSDIDHGILRSPVILTGRGGSGTRLLSELAQQSGVFLGNRLNESGDSVEWVDLFYELAMDRAAADSGIDYGGRAIADTRQWEPLLLARAKHILAAGAWSRGTPWGWKLPETMLAVPQIMDIFTGGKLVHLVRHPVSSSLRRQHTTSRRDRPVGIHVLRAAYNALGLAPELIDAHNNYMRNAITWLYQVDRVIEFGRNHLGPQRYMEVRYEDICADPSGAWRPVSDFLEIPWKEPSLPDLQPDRMQAFELADARVEEVWALCETTARKLGYEPVR